MRLSRLQALRTLSILLTFYFLWMEPRLLFAAANPEDAIASPWQDKAETLRYWTAERMKEAERIEDHKEESPPPQPPITPGGNIAGHAKSPRPYIDNFVSRVTGELFIHEPVPNRNAHCSASVIKSVSQRLLVTAAHCVLRGALEPPLVWNQYLMFVPAYDGSRAVEDEQRAPYGLWPVSRIYVSAILEEQPGLVASVATDLAVAGVFDRLPGERIEAVVGGGLNPRINAPPEFFMLTNTLGYPSTTPAGPYFGDTQYWCLSTTAEALGLPPPSCRIRYGHSGGPVVLVNALNPTNGTMDVVAVAHGSGSNARIRPVLFPNMLEMANSDHACNVVPCAPDR